VNNDHLVINKALCPICHVNPRQKNNNWCDECGQKYTEANGTRKRRGNPNWGRGPKAITAEDVKPTAFELEVQKFGLVESEYDHHPQLIAWVKKNSGRKYVPEWLLHELSIEPEVNLSEKLR
jgi:hypothetical protein